jgi:hypothetical protein
MITPEEQRLRSAFFHDPIYPGWRRWVFPSISGTLYVVTAAMSYAASHAASESRLHLVAGGLIVLWALGTPLWFIVEYMLMERRDPADLPNVEGFKYTQELCSKFWAVGVAILAAIYAGKALGFGA